MLFILFLACRCRTAWEQGVTVQEIMLAFPGTGTNGRYSPCQP
jgi:hypothetical protein